MKQYNTNNKDKNKSADLSKCNLDIYMLKKLQKVPLILLSEIQWYRIYLLKLLFKR